MANANSSTFARPKYQYRFMALARADRQAKPCKIIIEATSEQEDQQQSPIVCVIVRSALVLKVKPQISGSPENQSLGWYINHGCVTSSHCFLAGGPGVGVGLHFRRSGEWIISSILKCSGLLLADGVGCVVCFSFIACSTDYGFLGWYADNLIRQASITHAEKFLEFSASSATAICFSIEYEKRIFFVTVLLVRGFDGIAGSRSVSYVPTTVVQRSKELLDLYQYCLFAFISTVSEKKFLRISNKFGYINPAPHKTGAGRGNPSKLGATPDAASVFFVVRYTRHSMAWCAIPKGLRCRPAGFLSHHAAHNGAMCSNRCAGLAPNLLTPMNASRRPIMVTLAGLPKGRPVSSNAGISTPVNVTALFERGNSGGDSLNLLEEAAAMATVPTQNPLFVRCFKNNLHDVFIRGYAFSAPAKSGVGIGVPVKLQATNDAPASFLLSALAHIQIMAGRMGESKDSPVSCNAGYANPVRSATHEIGVSGGGIRYPLQEAAVMATTPTQSHPVSARHNHVNKPFFVFRFWSPHLLMRDTIATSEKQARSRLRRPSWTLDKRYPIPVTDAVYQVVSLMRYTDGRRRTCQHREIWTSREQAEEHAARVAFMTDYVTVTADVVEVFHV